MADKLSEFGYNFQIKLIASLFTDRAYLQQISDILEPNMFESEANYFIVDTIKKYFQTYKSPPTMEVMKVQVEEIDNDVLKTTVVDHLKDSYKQLESDDLEFVKEKTLMFCKNQKLKKAIIRSVDLLKDNDSESIKTVIDESLKAGSDRDVGHEYLEEIDLRYEESVRNVVTTGWEVIDDLADGGLGKGELGVMVAPAGIGKSWALVNIGANAVKAGLKVIHYTLELNEHYVGLRYDSVFTGISVQDLKFNIEEAKKTVSNMKGDLIIKQYPTKSASVSTIGAHIEKCRVQGWFIRC